MDYREFFLQPNWVLQSASRNLEPGSSQLLNKPLREHEELLKDINGHHWGANIVSSQEITELTSKYPSSLILYRLINHLCASKLPKYSISPLSRSLPKIAIVIPGQLRCLQSSYNFFSSLNQIADVFVCTSNDFREEALSISQNVYILGKEPALEVSSMQQWHKLYICLQQVKRQEVINGNHYEFILKLRTDFYLIKPENILKDLVNATGRLCCSSDKIFGGPRDIMMLFEGFYYSLLSAFFERGNMYSHLNLQQILNSDDSFKWYGFEFPAELFGSPNSVEELRKKIVSVVLSNPNQLLKTLKSTINTVSFFQGHPSFPSEICFAKYINFLGISVHSSPGFQGFLREDRFQ